MSETSNMTFRIGAQERRQLRELAERFERNESDTLRYLIRKTLREMDAAPKAQAETSAR